VLAIRWGGGEGQIPQIILPPGTPVCIPQRPKAVAPTLIGDLHSLAGRDGQGGGGA
jgi:hypothetical protein